MFKEHVQRIQRWKFALAAGAATRRGVYLLLAHFLLTRPALKHVSYLIRRINIQSTSLARISPTSTSRPGWLNRLENEQQQAKHVELPAGWTNREQRAIFVFPSIIPRRWLKMRSLREVARMLLSFLPDVNQWTRKVVYLYIHGNLLRSEPGVYIFGLSVDAGPFSEVGPAMFWNLRFAGRKLVEQEKWSLT